MPKAMRQIDDGTYSNSGKPALNMYFCSGALLSWDLADLGDCPSQC